MRNLFGVHLKVENTNMLYNLVPVLKFADVYHLRVSLIIYQSLSLKYANKVYTNIVELVNEHTYETRHCCDLNLPFPHSLAFKYNFVDSAISVWNKIPLNIRQSETVGTFKRLYKLYLLATYNDVGVG